MTDKERAALAAHITQERLARLAIIVFGVGGLVGAVYHGLTSILIGFAGAWVFGLARPGPNDELDDLTD